MAVELQWRRLLAYLLDRLSETSTWSGIVLMLTASGIAIAPERVALVTGLGLGLVGALRALLPNTLGGKDQ
jgi:hypothetical protein